ncbi:MAG: copper amine oxidase N-terminal domain-containing protein [Dehalobacterium sp.]
MKKKQYKKIFLACLLVIIFIFPEICIAATIMPEIEWDKNSNTCFKSVVPVDDGILALDYSDCLKKYGLSGDLIWEKSLEDDYFYRNTNNSSIIAVTPIQSSSRDSKFNEETREIETIRIENAIIKIFSPEFNLLNQLQLSCDNFYTVRQTRDNGILCITDHDYDEKFLLTKYNTKGERIWDTIVTSALLNPKEKDKKGYGLRIREIFETNKQDLLVLGTVWIDGKSGHDLWILKLNAIGDILWEKNFNKEIGDQFISLVEDNNNNIYILGESAYYDPPGTTWMNSYLTLIKLDNSGKVIWQKNYSDIYTSQNIEIDDEDGNLIIGGHDQTNKTYWDDIVLLKIDKNNGKKLSKKVFKNKDSDFVYSFNKTFDGGYILMVSRTDYSNNRKSTYSLVKMKSESIERFVPVKINNKFVTFNHEKPFIEKQTGRVFLPLRLISNILGCEVEWNAKTNTVLIKKENIEISLSTKSTSLDASAKVINGKTFVPLRFISEALNVKVEYANGVVYIN